MESLGSRRAVPVSRSVVDRALAFLGTFRAGRERQTLSGLSKRSGLPVATAYRIVQRLTAWGALERDADGAYRVGIRLWEIGSLAARSSDLQHVARPYMHDLHEMTHLNVHLAIREGTELVSVEHFHGAPSEPSMPRFVGQRHPFHPTAIGLVLLSHAPEAVRREILAAPQRRFTSHTCVDREELVRTFREIRSRGYALSDRQVDLEHVGVAAPVHAPDGAVIAALSLVSEHGPAPVNSMIHAVRIAASGISRGLREVTLLGPASTVEFDQQKAGA